MAQIVAGPIQHDSSLYYLVGPTTWTDAENQALALGGHLVTINDAAENAWVTATFLPYGLGMLIGLTDADSEGQWRWISGAPVSYFNWNQDYGEPNGATSENYGELYADGRWNDCSCVPKTGVVEVPCTIQKPSEWSWHGDTEFGTFGGAWGDGANWTPQGVPAHDGVANFEIPEYYFVDLEANRRIGAIVAKAGFLNLNFNGFTLDRPMGCTLFASLAVWPAAGATAQARLGVGLNGEGGFFNAPRAVAVGLEPNSTGVLEISGVTLDAGDYVFAGAGFGCTGVIDLAAGGTILAHASVLVGARDSTGTIDVGSGGVLRVGGAARLGAAPGGTGTLNIGNGGLVTSLGSISQVLVGAAPGDVGGATTIGLLNLHTGGVLNVAEVNLGTAERSRGAFTIDGGLLNMQSLIIGDRGIGQFEWSAGTITGMENITIGKEPGSDGRLDLEGPAQSLTFTSGGGNALIAVGQLGRGLLHVEKGARVDLTAGSTGGMSIGNAAGARGFVLIAGPDSAVIADEASTLITGNSGTSGSLTEALVIEDHGQARFGKAFIGNSPGRAASYAGDASIRTRGRLEVTLDADSIGGSDGLIVGNSDRSASLKVESGGTVECTSGWAYNTNELGPVIHITGVDEEAFPPLPSSLACSGNFYIAGQLPSGASMLVENGAVMNTSNLYLGWSAGTPFRGELELDGPRQVLTNTGTLTLGVLGDAQALGRLVLRNGARVRTHRLSLGDAYFVTNGTKNNPQLMVGGAPLLPPDIHCDTLLVESTFDVPEFDVIFGAGAGIGGHGTWPSDFTATQGGEVVVPPGPIEDLSGPMPHLTIGANLTLDSTALVEIAATWALPYDSSGVPIGTFVDVTGDAHLDGALRFSLWTGFWSRFDSAADPIFLIGQTLPILTAASITGTFESVDFGPGFPTNRVQLTYEPTRVLATFLPPVCDPSIDVQPRDDPTCPGGVATFTIGASGSPDGFGGPVAYEWEWYLNAYYGWLPLSEGDNYVPDTGTVLFRAQGAQTGNLSTTTDPAVLTTLEPYSINSLSVRCVVSNSCSSLASAEAILRVCAADFTCDGVVNSQDFFNFLTAFFSAVPAADFNHDSQTNSQDFFDFLAAFFAGC